MAPRCRGYWNTVQSWLWYNIVVQATIQGASAGYDMTHIDVSNTSYYKELAQQNIIVVDELHNHPLEARQNVNDNASTGSGLPEPFDTSLGSNFTESSCPAYFEKFLADTTFQSCLPMSLLLQNSRSFFEAVRSPDTLQKTVEQSCSASLAVCSPLMTKYGEDLISDGNCHGDYNRENPLVLQAYAGFQAYESLYQATCSKDNSTGQYCFLQAMNSSTADDSYPYYTAIGLQLPTTSQPQCTTCLKQTMEIFAGYSEQADQPLANTYPGCATQVNSVCGSGFASTQVASVSRVASTNGTSQSKFLDISLLVASLWITSLFM